MQIIKYYMTYRYGALLHIGAFIFVILYSWLMGRDITGSVGFITGFAMVSYLTIFIGNKNEKFDAISKNIPISNIKLTLAKYISFFIYLTFYFLSFCAYAVITGNDAMEIAGNLTSAFTMIYLFSSVLGKIRNLLDRKRIINIPNLIYIGIGVLAGYLIYTSGYPDYINSNGYITHTEYMVKNLGILFLLASSDFIAMYLNRNKLEIV